MGTLVQYDKPDLPAVGAATAKANIICIDDQTTYEMASDVVVRIKTRRGEIDAMRKSIVDPINKAKDAVQAIFNPVLADYDAAEKIVKTKMIAYVNEQEEIRRKAQAEADRVAREAAAKAEKEAAKLEKKGNVEAAEAIREIAAVTSAPVIAPLVTQVGGNSVRKVWKARVTDLPAFLAALANHPEYHGLVTFNQAAADKLVSATNGNLRIAGLETYQDSVVAIRK
jgi:hypothetical protein